MEILVGVRFCGVLFVIGEFGFYFGELITRFKEGSDKFMCVF